MSLSGSNSTVERAFSLLTLLLSDRRLKLGHKTVEDLMLININNKLWTPKEKEEIVLKTAEKFENAKQRVRTFDKMPEKHLVIEMNTEKNKEDEDYSTDSETSETDSESSEGFSDYED